jgi:filamentous hemagglutinin family protein
VLSSGITTDGTMGAAQSLSGTQISIPQALGTTVGQNLFHSFADFNINNGQTVVFSGNDSLVNVISRVTGGNATVIDGLLKSDLKNADFYFINPNGITFGATAQVDVPAAFHISTADKIDLGKNGAVFYADALKNNQLSTELPTAFGFLGTSTATNGLLAVDGSQLNLKNGQSLDAVAGKITLANKALITAPAGELRLVALQGLGSVSLEKSLDGSLSLPTLKPTMLNAGTISLSTSTLDTSGDSSGTIGFWGANTSLMTSQLLNNNSGSIDASTNKGLNIKAWSLTDTDSSIYSDSNSLGKAADIMISAETMAMMVSAAGRVNPDTMMGNISSSANNSGAAGNITISTNTLSLDDQSWINTDTNATGAGGDLGINATLLNNNGYITANANDNGKGGHISIKATTLNSNGPIGLYAAGAISTDSSGSGAAGSILVSTDNLTMNGAYISSKALASGAGGNVSIMANTIAMNNGEISSNSSGIDASGAGGHVSVSTTNLTLSNEANISSNTFDNSTGNAGDVLVNAKNITLLSDSYISSSTSSTGNAGKVSVTSDKLTIDGAKGNRFTGIISLTKKDRWGGVSGGDGGSVLVNAGNITLQNAGTISSSSNAKGHAGNVSVVADTMTLDSSGNISSNAMESSSGKVGDIAVVARDSLALHNKATISDVNYSSSANLSAEEIIGKVSVTAPTIVIDNGTISSTSTGNIAAAAIDVHFTKALCMTHASINTSANNGNGGYIKVTGDGLIYLTDSSFITSVSGATSNGGDIATSASMLVIDRGLIQANAVSGNGGNINLKVDALIPSSNTLTLGGAPVTWQSNASTMNVIQASSQSGLSGAINNTAPQLSLSGVLATINNSSFDSHLISQDYCALGNGSSLTKKGKGGLPSRAKDLQVF